MRAPRDFPEAFADLEDLVGAISSGEARWDAIGRERDPSAGEIAAALGWEKGQAEDALSVPPDPTSLDRPVGPAEDEDSAELGAMIADGSPEAAPEDRAVEAIETAEATAAIENALHSLTPPERAIIVRRYGIDGRQPKKLAEIADEFGLSRERVRQLQRRAEDAISRALRDRTA